MWNEQVNCFLAILKVGFGSADAVHMANCAVEQEITGMVITCHSTRNSPLIIRLGLGKQRRAAVLVVFPRTTENVTYGKEVKYAE